MSQTDETSGESKFPPKGGIIVSTLKKRLRSPWEGAGLHLSKKPNEAIFQRGIPPKQPRIPFEHEPASAPASEPTPPALHHHHARHGMIASLRSRRKGRQRIINFILLPLAVLATGAFVVWILKFL